MHRRAFIFGSLAGISALPIPAEAASWVTLGDRSVNLLADFDIIVVGPYQGLFSALRLEARGNDVYMRSLRVVFLNGERADITVRSLIRDGRRTLPLPLPGALRAIRRIELFYARGIRAGTARITVEGLRAPGF